MLGNLHPPEGWDGVTPLPKPTRFELLTEQPWGLRQGPMYPYQLEGLNFLRQRFAQSSLFGVVLIGGMGELVRLVTRLAWLSCLRKLGGAVRQDFCSRGVQQGEGYTLQFSRTEEREGHGKSRREPEKLYPPPQAKGIRKTPPLPPICENVEGPQEGILLFAGAACMRVATLFSVLRSWLTCCFAEPWGG